VASLKMMIVENYCLDDDIANQLEFLYRAIAGYQGKEEIKRYTDTDFIPSKTRRTDPTSANRVPVKLEDINLQVRYKEGDEIEEDVSCDSEFMLSIMDRVGAALREKFWWVKQSEWIYLVMDNAGGHGTKEAWEKFTNDLATKHKVKIIRQCPRSPETNVLDLGIWLSIQAEVEKKMHMRRATKKLLQWLYLTHGRTVFLPNHLQRYATGFRTSWH
jgi:hypothetical protein